MQPHIARAFLIKFPLDQFFLAAMRSIRPFKLQLVVTVAAIALITAPQALLAQVPDEAVVEKACSDVFPNLISDFFARRNCISNAIR